MTRTDTHRVSIADPAEYENIGDFDNHHEDGYCWIADGFHDKDTFEGNYERRGRCDHCGAGPLRYGAIFYHAPTDTTIVVGLTCAAKLGMKSKSEYQAQREAKARREERERRETAEAFEATLTDEARAAIEMIREAIRTPYVDEDGNDTGWRFKYPALRGDNPAFDILHKLNRYGSLSEKQVAFLVRTKERNDEWTAERKAKEAALEDAPKLAEGRQTIEGKVVSIKDGENDYGYWIKMLVETDEGNRVYGTIPSIIESRVEKGTRVKFDAKVEPKEEHFGFFSRPTKAEVLV